MCFFFFTFTEKRLTEKEKLLQQLQSQYHDLGKQLFTGTQNRDTSTYLLTHMIDVISNGDL